MNKNKYKRPNTQIPNNTIPDNWERFQLGNGDFCDIIMGQSPPSSGYNSKGNGLPFLQGKIEFGNIYPSPIKYCSKPIKIAKKDDILISVRAPVGDVNITLDELCIGRGLAAIRCKPAKLQNLFLFYYMKLIAKKLENIASGSTFKAIRKPELEALELRLPPLSEQKKIAQVLSTVDQASEKVGEAIEKTQRLKRGLMHELLTRGIGHKEFKETEIGMIPKNWEARKIEKICIDFVSGGTPSTSNKKYWNGEIPWMTSAFITEREIKTGQRYITKEGLRNSATNVVPKDNLVVATRVGIGKAAINRVDLAISQDLTGMIIDKKQAYPDFLYWALTNSETKLRSLAQGSTIKGILREGLGKIKLPLPPLAEQQEIAEILSSVDKRVEALRSKKEKLEKVKKRLMEDLLTGRVRVIPLIEKET